ncbi:AIG2 family protein [Toxoplasma gondii p89]|uniref:AIG2 family protein n=1 Tax=Toxoplasma gondii p89 TaxID=943119 RepID=A0A086K2M0_TOXGO|nr:AIG2 family protein [Toxoplasma gondii p89]
MEEDVEGTSAVLSLGCRSPLEEFFGENAGGLSAATRRISRSSLLASKLGDAASQNTACQTESSIIFDGEGSPRSDGDSTRGNSPPFRSSEDTTDKRFDQRARGEACASCEALSRSCGASCTPLRDEEEPDLACDATPLVVTLSPSSASAQVYRHLVFVYGTLKRGMPNHHIFTRIASEASLTDQKAECVSERKANCASQAASQAVGAAGSPDALRESLEEAAEGLDETESPRQVVYLFDAVTTEPYPLFMDANQRYRPCLFDARGLGQKVRGEVYAVTDEILQSLDTFERVPHHYRRRSIRVQVVPDSAPAGSPSEVSAHVYFNVHADVLARVLNLEGGAKRCEEKTRGCAAKGDAAEEVTYIHNYDSSHAQLYVPRFKPPDDCSTLRLPSAKGIFRTATGIGSLSEVYPANADIRRSRTLPSLSTPE